MTLDWYGNTFECDYAAKDGSTIRMYDSTYKQTGEIIHLSERDWEHITLTGGDWSEPADIPTREEVMQSEIDYLMMITEDL